MKGSKKQSALRKFLEDKKQYPIITALGAGLYPIFFYYSNNYSLINTWKHLGFFIALFVLGPIAVFTIANKLANRKFFSKWKQYVLPFLNVLTFLIFIELCLYARIQMGLTIAAVVIAGLFAYFLHKHIKKLIVLQLIMAVVSIVTLVPIIVNQLNYSTAWMEQPDAIDQAVFKKRPNVYYIQSDGYVNFSEIDKGHYNIDNSVFRNYLEENNFKIYLDIRGNYRSTLVSNSATFMMKHHYYNGGFNFSESVDARDIIITKNTVLDVFKNNNYTTHFLSEGPYLLANRPKMGYDKCNFNTEDVSYIGTGYEKMQNVTASLESYLQDDIDKEKFFFIQMFTPGHIVPNKSDSAGIEGERELWIERMESSHTKMEQMIDLINKHDPNALIMIMGDHGGFVGLEYSKQTRNIASLDRDILYSVFSVNLSIKWPNGEAPEIDKHFRSSVNVFRILISYLTEDISYLDHLQNDSSYLHITEGAPKGVYECIDTNGKITIKKFKENLEK